MKKLVIALALLPLLALCDQTLTLTWVEPAGYQSTLYSTTNLNGNWTAIGVVSPPYLTETTNQVTFFYVSVAPTNQVNGPLIYVVNPNTENIVPTFTNKPAMAYSETGGGIWAWSVTEQTWN